MQAAFKLIILAALAYATYSLLIPHSYALSASDVAHADRVVKQFMDRYKVPGLSIAWAKDGKIIFAKGYGFANRKARRPVTTQHVFRIASISKPITATMIMRLVEQGRLTLDALVFGAGGILENDYKVSDSYVKQISVRHLLEHGAGRAWSSNKNDPMFQREYLTQRALIQWVLDSRNLSQRPGSSYHYSNFGYSVLGRVIEKVSGEPYVDHFINNTANLGLTSFALANEFKSDGEHEVTYYAQEQQSPYSFPISRMDAHGGWLATPTDLVKYFLLVDGFDPPADILQPSSIQTMTLPGPHNPNYAKGWAVNQHDNWWHIGSLPGSSSVAVRTSDNMVWAVFTNTRSPDKNYLADLDGLMWKVVAGIAHQ